MGGFFRRSSVLVVSGVVLFIVGAIPICVGENSQPARTIFAVLMWGGFLLTMWALRKPSASPPAK